MTLTREQLLQSLHADWGTFVDRFQRLFPKAQTAYLQQQGYARFADLLAHIIAWWQGGLSDIPQMLADPAYTSPNQNVDQFNALAVQKFAGVSEATVSMFFEELRQQWLTLINGLPWEAFQNQSIADRLYMELIGHFAEHRF